MIRVQLLVDNPDSWVVPYAHELVNMIGAMGIEVNLHHQHNEVQQGDVLCMLACERLFKRLDLNRHNLVVHESALPSGERVVTINLANFGWG